MNKFIMAKDIINKHGAYYFNSNLMQKSIKGNILSAKVEVEDISAELANQVCNRVELIKYYNPLQCNTGNKEQRDFFVKTIQQINKVYKNKADTVRFDLEVEYLTNILSYGYDFEVVSKNNVDIIVATETNELTKSQKAFLEKFSNSLKTKCEKLDFDRGYDSEISSK